MKQVILLDHSALRTNQAAIIALLVTAFIIEALWLVALVAIVMLAATAAGRPAFGWLYTALLRPARIMRPDVLMDKREPHLFAQGFGGLVLAGSLLAHLSGAVFLGWVLIWLVVALAGLNLLAGFCLGCALYYWFHRLHVPGFTQAPPEGTFPGLRPRRRVQ